MIRPSRPQDSTAVAHHYDELDRFYRTLWGDHLHHGLWTTGEETPEEAARALVDEVAQRAGIAGGGSRAQPDVCDVGSGYGAVARRLTAFGARVTGLTVSEAQYRYAIGRVVTPPGRTASAHGPAPSGSGASASGDPSPRFLLRDWLANGLPDASFDAVVAIESLSHMADPGRAVEEAFRVLRPGGRFVACVWLAAERPAPWEVRWLLGPVCDEGRLPGLPAASEYGRWLGRAGFVDASLVDLSRRVARTWSVVAKRVAGAMLRPGAWRYLLDRRNTERAFAFSVMRLLVGFRTGAMRYGIVTGRRPTGSEARP